MTSTRSLHTTADEIRALGPWFHNIRINGIATAPEHFLGDYPSAFFERFASALPVDLRGWSVLDIGCNAGFYSFEMARRGAARVLGIDHDERYLAQARYAARALGQTVEFQQRSVYDLHALQEKFDLVLFMGVLYHLRHPLLALDLLRRYAVGRLLVFQTMIRGETGDFTPREDYAFEDRTPFLEPTYPRMFFVERKYADDPTNWWIPNPSCAGAMLRSAGFTIVSHPDPEVFVCEPGSEPAELPDAFAAS
jgi:tRNA (mo5U34)-methyltransferase